MASAKACTVRLTGAIDGPDNPRPRGRMSAAAPSQARPFLDLGYDLDKRPFDARRKPGRRVAMTGEADDGFFLYDLRVELVRSGEGRIVCGNEGDWFELRGEMLHLPQGQGFSIYSIGALLPLLAARQRESDPNDWMSTDAEVACPDPNCPSRLRITRLGRRRFSHAGTTNLPLADRSGGGGDAG
jgi:uncharacterized repeat protein (TIGR04076 family)